MLVIIFIFIWSYSEFPFIMSRVPVVYIEVEPKATMVCEGSDQCRQSASLWCRNYIKTYLPSASAQT